MHRNGTTTQGLTEENFKCTSVFGNLQNKAKRHCAKVKIASTSKKKLFENNRMHLKVPKKKKNVKKVCDNKRFAVSNSCQFFTSFFALANQL